MKSVQTPAEAMFFTYISRSLREEGYGLPPSNPLLVVVFLLCSAEIISVSRTVTI